MQIRFLYHAMGVAVVMCLIGTTHETHAQSCPTESKTGYQPTDGTSWCVRSAEYWSSNEYTDADRAACAARSEPQSPINLRPPQQAKPELGRLVFDYGSSQTSNLVMMNNGHTVELLLGPEQYKNGEATHHLPDGAEVPAAPPERTITISGTRYVLQNVHFHFPSEHLINGERFPMEMHIVHQVGTRRAVVAVLFEVGTANDALNVLFDNMTSTKAKDQKVVLTYDALNLRNVVPADGTYMRYEGSLTTPDCGTGVTWIVFRTPVQVTQAQIDQFKAAIKGPLVFPVNARQWRESAIDVGLFAPSNRPGVSCVSIKDAQFHCFVRGANQSLWHYSSTAKSWEDSGGLPLLTLLDPPECLSPGPDRIDCFVRGADQALQRRSWSEAGGWEPWASLGGTIMEPPRCVSWGPNRIDCLVRGADSKMWHRSFDGAWRGWVQVGPGREFLSPPECVTWPSLIICVVLGRYEPGDTPPALLSTVYNGSAWEEIWANLGSSVEQPGCWLRSPGSFVCRARRSDGTLWRIDYERAWGSWTLGGGARTNRPSCVDGTTWQPGRCFTRGTDQALYDDAAVRIGGPITEQPHCINSAAQIIDCFGRTSHGTMWHRRNSYGVWGAWENLGGMILE